MESLDKLGIQLVNDDSNICPSSSTALIKLNLDPQCSTADSSVLNTFNN